MDKLKIKNSDYETNYKVNENDSIYKNQRKTIY